jgi:DNA-binding MarR family transcriptional regulator
MNIDEMPPEWLFKVCDRMHHCMMSREFELRGLSKATHPFLLFALKAEGPGESLSQKELAEKLGVAPPTAAVSIRRMERAGLLAKKADREDSRRNCITLTPKGARLVTECREAFEDIDRKMFEGFSEQDKGKMRSYYIRMIRNLEAMGAQVPAELKGSERTC